MPFRLNDFVIQPDGGFDQHPHSIFGAGRFNMKHYSEKQIIVLQQEFKAIKRYSDKLSFYDRHFGIIPFDFPAFDPALSLFFEKEKAAALCDIFKKERNNPGLTEKQFRFQDEYRFNIKPANSNNAVYSNYILSQFLAQAPDFDGWMAERERQSNGSEPCRRVQLEKANALLNEIEYRLRHDYDKSLLLHCMAVFYKGFYDAFTGSIVLPDKKRKFIELYLYALGMIYAQYVNRLREKTK
jgi:hypothetical protein